MGAKSKDQQVLGLIATEGMLMQAIMTAAQMPGLQSFHEDIEVFAFKGVNASVEFVKDDGSLRIFQKGQAAPFYESNDRRACPDLPYADELGMELIQELTRSMVRNQAARMNTTKNERLG